MKQNKKIITKIRKLLALSESPNEAEAASALAKAKMLLSQYGLSEDDISELRPGVEKTVVAECDSLPPWQEKLLKLIIRSTNTEVLKVYMKKSVIIEIIGRNYNVITARLLFEYLTGAVESSAVLFKGGVDPNSYGLGIAVGRKISIEKQVDSNIS